MALIIEISPGPNFLLITKTVPTAGRLSAFANISGFATAFAVHGYLSIFGFSVILARSDNLFFTVKILGAAYLYSLGVQAIYEALTRLSSKPVKAGSLTDGLSDSMVVPLMRQSLTRGWREGFITNCLNPKTCLFYLAAFPQFLGEGWVSENESFFLVIVHIAISATWFVLVAVAIERLIGATRSNRLVYLIRMLSGFALLGFGAFFAASAAFH